MSPDVGWRVGVALQLLGGLLVLVGVAVVLYYLLVPLILVTAPPPGVEQTTRGERWPVRPGRECECGSGFTIHTYEPATNGAGVWRLTRCDGCGMENGLWAVAERGGQP